jgi:hypothetical protein
MVPADLNFVRRKLKGVSPASAGVKERDSRPSRARSGLGRKNRLRVAPLRDPKNLVRLFLLPGKIRKEMEAKRKVLRDDALLMQLAVALLILTYAPTLTPIRIGSKSIYRPGAR